MAAHSSGTQMASSPMGDANGQWACFAISVSPNMPDLQPDLGRSELDGVGHCQCVEQMSLGGRTGKGYKQPAQMANSKSFHKWCVNCLRAQRE